MQEDRLDLRRQILIRKVDQRLLLCQSLPQPSAPRAVHHAQGATALPQGLSALGLGFGFDQIRDAFGFQQVDAAMGEGPTRKFARLCGKCPKLHQSVGDRVHHGWTGMQM